MSQRILPLAIACAFILANPAKADETSAEDLCDVALAALDGPGPTRACAEAGFGVALAPDGDRAGQLARLGQAGEERFRRHFGRDAPQYALIEIDDPERLGDEQRALLAAGFQRTLPWFSRAGYVQMYQDSLRRAAEERARAQGANDAAAQAAGDAAVAQGNRSLTPFALDANEATVVPHEIGHGWYVETYWPGRSMDRQGHYGGPGPDWLDEVAPILLESGDSAEMRRGVFRSVYRGAGTGMLADYPVEDLIDLGRFLSRDHPAHSENAEAANETAGTGMPTIRVLSGPEAQSEIADLREAAIFYPQGRMFADFLIDRTGDPAVFGDIGEAFGRGEPFETWLAANGEARGLAVTVPDLDRQWKAWLEGRFGPPGS